ncbi:hypothetical protein [Alloscardovia omnicolens]|uniref:hypothetical protein n=1 Tax=Alloscardovia omnicolens TaxID=419015 RepID=UPI00254B501C|nr:hypothetical protein [Alloscardovia omnicolens]MDK6643099.1 hypothetical protein [Alloscardovia omnicolens]
MDNSFLNDEEKQQFAKQLAGWSMLLELRILADKQAKLDTPSLRTGNKANAPTPINFNLDELYEQCSLLLSNMATLCTVHHDSQWENNLLYLQSHIDGLIVKDGFPPLYARFILLNAKLCKALARPEDRVLAGKCIKCGREVYAAKHDLETHCEYCGMLNDLTTLRAELKNQREQLLKNRSLYGSLKQLTQIVNMVNETSFTASQVRQLIRNKTIRGLKIGGQYWSVDSNTIRLDRE